MPPPLVLGFLNLPVQLDSLVDYLGPVGFYERTVSVAQCHERLA